MNQEIKKEERTESVFIYLTPSAKKEFEAAKDNQNLKESIIRNFLQSERNWLEQEIKEIDESTIRYSAKLIGIKDAFSKTQDAYVPEIEQISTNAYSTFRKLDNIASEVGNKIDATKSKLDAILKRIETIDFYKIEKILEVINKVNAMGNSELELLKKLLF